MGQTFNSNSLLREILGRWVTYVGGGLHMKGDMSLLTEQKTSNVKVTPVVWEIATLADFVNIFIFF